MENVTQISDQIKQELRSVGDEVTVNGAVQKHHTDVFTPGPSQTKVTKIENNEKSLNASYSKVSAHLYEYGMPVLNRLAVKVEESSKFAEVDKEMIENLETSIREDFAEIQKEELQQVEQSFKNELDHSTKSYNLISDRLNELRAAYEIASQKVKRFIPVVKFKSTPMYYLLLIFIGICEVPLNIVIFQAFGESDWITVIMAGTLAIAVPVIAHFIGMFWRQRSEMKDYKWKALVLTTLFLATNTGLGVFRANVLTQILLEAGQVVTQSDFMLNVAIFLGITTILFLIGVVAAYFRHDESYMLEHTYKNYNDYLAVYNQEKLRHEGVINSTQQSLINAKSRLADRYKGLVEHTLKRPVYALATHNQNVSNYEHALETFRGLEKLIQAEYNRVAGGLGIKSNPLETNFMNLKEFFVQK